MGSGTIVPAAEVLAELSETLADCPPLDEDHARATGLAAAVLAPAQDPGADPELARLLPSTLEGLGDQRAVALLLRIRELGRPAAAEAAAEALERLRDSGVPVRDLDPLEVVEAWRVSAPAADGFAVDLGRRGRVESRLFVIVDRRDDPAGVVSAGCAGAPCEGESLEQIVPVDFAGGSDPERIDTPTLAEALQSACECASAARTELPADLVIALTLLARPVLGDPDALPVLAVDPTSATVDEIDSDIAVDLENHERAGYAVIDALITEYEQEYLPFLADSGRNVAADTDLFVANTMLDYKASYSDGLLGDWTLAELMDFMLEFWPRKVTADEDTEIGAPVSIVRFLAFLDDRGSLSGSSRKRLIRAVGDLVEPFLDACDDQTNWGPAKSLVKNAEVSGIDIHDQAALRDYLTTIGPATSPARDHRPGADNQQQRRARRKAAKNARRRNRR
jgi:hypothetical protein